MTTRALRGGKGPLFRSARAFAHALHARGVGRTAASIEVFLSQIYRGKRLLPEAWLEPIRHVLSERALELELSPGEILATLDSALIKRTPVSLDLVTDRWQRCGVWYGCFQLVQAAEQLVNDIRGAIGRGERRVLFVPDGSSKRMEYWWQTLDPHVHDFLEVVLYDSYTHPWVELTVVSGHTIDGPFGADGDLFFIDSRGCLHSPMHRFELLRRLDHLRLDARRNVNKATALPRLLLPPAAFP